MIETLPWEHDPVTGKVTKWYHYDHTDDSFYIEDVVDLAGIAEYNKEARKANTGRFGDGMHWIGAIDTPTYWRLKKRGVFDDQKEFRKWWLSDESAPYRGRDMKV